MASRHKIGIVTIGGEAMHESTQLERITVDPQICRGQPKIRGLRITVSVIVKMMADGASIADVLAAYPELEEEDVRQALNGDA